MADMKLPIFEVGPCKDSYQFGYLIGQRFSKQIRSRLATDLILQKQLLPYAHTTTSQPFIETLTKANKNKFPAYWDELQGTADGSGVATLDLVLLNFRKEIQPFLPKTEIYSNDSIDDCSDVHVVSDYMAVTAHNEDANVALVGHTYMIKATLCNGLCFTAYTYAGELPSCAFGFNNHGLVHGILLSVALGKIVAENERFLFLRIQQAFTLNSVPPSEEEIVANGIGRNFISRDLLEATSIDDALNRLRCSEASVGHSYNLIDTKTRRILNVETASRNRISVKEISETPFFHANMYLHLDQVKQVHDANSLSRQRRAALLPKQSKNEFLSLLGDMEDTTYPIYMTGPILYTLCTAVFDLDERTLSIIEGNPKNGHVTHVFSISYEEEMTYYISTMN